MRGIALLGSTGSIGVSTLKVLERHRDRFRLVTMTGGKNRTLLEAQVAEWKPQYAGLAQADGKNGVATGPDCLVEAATHPDVVVVGKAVVEAAGLGATLAARRAV